jgi:hypothetical protein
MSTEVLSATLVRKRASCDRIFYLAMALASEIIIVAGFSPTYYLRFHYPVAASLSPLVQIHGFIFSLWMIYFVAQTFLIAVKRPALHRRLGIAGAFLGSTAIGTGLLVAFVGMRLGHGSPAQDAEVIFLVGLVDIGSFALFFILGYWLRRDTESHRRLMLLAVIVTFRDQSRAPSRRAYLRSGHTPQNSSGLPVGRALCNPYLHALSLPARRNSLVAPYGSPHCWLISGYTSWSISTCVIMKYPHC